MFCVVPVKSIPKEEVVICIPILYVHLEDRTFDIRSSSQKAILGVMMHVGYDCMAKHLEKLKPGSQSEVRKKLENERGKLPAPVTKKAAEKEEKTVRGTKPVANAKNAVKPKVSQLTPYNSKKKFFFFLQRGMHPTPKRPPQPPKTRKKKTSTHRLSLLLIT